MSHPDSEGLRNDSIEALSRPGSYGLDPQSFTAQKLQHASPQHLHLTSRRCFIGPVPQDWLSKHRKSWYHYRPHRYESFKSKTAAFTAGSSLAEFRRLTGLDEPVDKLKRQNLSFPQPSDVDVDEDLSTVQEEGVGSDGAQPEGAGGTDGTKILKKGGKGGESKRRRFSKGPLKIIHRSQGGRARDEPVSAGKSTGESFVTASEQPGSAKTPTTPPKNQSSEAAAPVSSSRDSQQSNEGGGPKTDSQATTPDGAREEADSRSSLLAHGKDDAGKESKAKATQAGNKLEIMVTAATGDAQQGDGSDQPETDAQNALESVQESEGRDSQARLDVPPEDQDGGHPSLRRLDPVSTGLVRFNLPNDDEAFEDQGQKRIAEARILKSFRDMGKARARPGQLLKAERMLVRVDSTRQEVPSGYNENDSLGIETKLVEKWREYIVVCRRNPNGDESQLVLRMEKTRVIPAMDPSGSQKAVHEIALSPKNAKINMYNSLDKSIVMWAPWNKGTRIYIIRPRSFASSVEWYTFLHTALGWLRSPSVAVHIPHLNMTVNIEKPFQEINVSGTSTPSADKSDNSVHAKAKRMAEGQAAQLIIDRSLEMLKNSPAHDILTKWAEHEDRIGLAWKRYDRLEWVHGANEERMYGSIAMAQTHDLELRPKTHYPTQVHLGSHRHDPVEEPAPVEGFLTRLTSQQGASRRLGRQFSKRLYYSTHNQYLCFSSPGKVLPPKPPGLPRVQSNHGQMPSPTAIANRIPDIFIVDPYPIENDEIAWLSGEDMEWKQEYDQRAYEESERTVNAMLEAEGYVNLCHVVRVHKAKAGTNAPPPQGTDADDLDADDSPSEDEAEPVDDKTAFELTLRNGLVVRLQAFTEAARKEWIKRLREIIKYWKLRAAEDMFLYRSVRKANLEKLDIDESMESYLGQFAQKWEVAKAVASSELFNVCGISCCRSVTVSHVAHGPFAS